MISVLLLGFDGAGRAPAAPGDAVRSLASLVPAAVEGIVRDVCLASPSDRALSEVAEHAGCSFLAVPTVREAIREGARQLRNPSVLVAGCGLVMERAVLDELTALLPTLASTSGFRSIRAIRDDLIGRLFPGSAPTAALLAPRTWLEQADAASFGALMRQAKSPRALRSRVWIRR